MHVCMDRVLVLNKAAGRRKGSCIVNGSGIHVIVHMLCACAIIIQCLPDAYGNFR